MRFASQARMIGRFKPKPQRPPETPRPEVEPTADDEEAPRLTREEFQAVLDALALDDDQIPARFRPEHNRGG